MLLIILVIKLIESSHPKEPMGCTMQLDACITRCRKEVQALGRHEELRL